MSVFGAATIDVAPDLARLRIGIKELGSTPAKAFGDTRAAANTVWNYNGKNRERTEARTAAVAAAREKAEVYAEAARVKVGRVLHITDVDSDGSGPSAATANSSATTATAY